ncbi:hypothetical protein DEIPH_ctg026orf0051 [Deinococcus phoenicis]|uniref:BioF2-like acetyltransferase domain-containing protein n=1 Tax=Deinococcus phoenicis TaxID=1476583 RepID=A0A016QQK0_9DEIO|nr:hypothetical protein DEIPH_ctg026orf0051 [Deinococcus phoenicis]
MEDRPLAAMHPSLFQTAWWLDAVAPHAWDEVQVHENGLLVARLPFVRSRRHGLTRLTQPPLGRTLGPWLAYSSDRYDRRLAQHKAWLGALIDQLPPFDLFEQNCSPELDNWLPFYWRGFSQTTRYTYRFERVDDLPAMRRRMNSNLRADLNRGTQQLEVRESEDVEQLWQLCRQTFERQGEHFPFSRPLVERAYGACRQRQAGTILLAVDDQDRVHAANFFVWDDHTLFGLLNGRTDQFRIRGAQALLIWEAMDYAARRKIAFDFQGSMIESIEGYFRGFGARLTPYSHISKTSGRYRTLHQTQSILSAAAHLLPGKRG